MKYIKIISLLFIFQCCEQPQQKKTEATKSKQDFYIGTYTDKNSKGIYKYTLDEDGKLEKIGLATTSINPAFLSITKDGKYLVAVNEIDTNGTGTIESYHVQNDTLLFINRQNTGGEHPCFVAINEANFVISANYTGGNVALHQLNEKGELSNLLHSQQHIGSDTTARQEAAHAHSTWFVPNSNEVISVDLGTNELWVSYLNDSTKTLDIKDTLRLKMESGAGPRHLDFHPNGKWIYVLNELNATITLVQKKEGEYTILSSVSTLPTEFKDFNLCADIHISSDGKFLYASNRGHNTIAIFSIGEDGLLTTVGFESILGDWPRNFSLSPDEKYLLVANQNTNNIVCFKRDNTSGLLTKVSEIEAPNPVCIVFN